MRNNEDISQDLDRGLASKTEEADMVQSRETSTASIMPRIPVPIVDGQATAAPLGPGEVPENLRSPELYLNRELTWLNFCQRVLHEAEDPRTPLLERLKFLAIVGSNLDEFFMKRIGGLKQQQAADLTERTVDGRTPAEQIKACYAMTRGLFARAQATRRALLDELEVQGIRIVSYGSLSAPEREALRQEYLDNVFPLVTPQSIDPAHPFPFVSNLSINLLVALHYPNDETPLFARVKLPLGGGIPRFLQVGDSFTFVPLEEVMAESVDLLFPNMKVEACELFRVTRNAATESDEDEADDLVEMIESELRERKFAPVVRLQVTTTMRSEYRGRLAAELGIGDAEDVFEVDGMMGLRDLLELTRLPFPELREAAHRPVEHPLLAFEPNIFHVVREVDALLLHHPYHSFATSVERFLREASTDPKVRAIKMTLYRTSKGTSVIDHLISAARNGKQVAVVVELKARFDEEANLRWANRLESAGIHVTYGVVGLKTHAKTIIVVRQDHDGLRRYVHIGTGNYHAGTAKLYSDMGLLTCDEALTRDVTELFNYLTTGYRTERRYERLLLAPAWAKRGILERIRREATHARRGERALIQMKTNALEDADIVHALYEASKAGVKIDLIVRDTCRLRPGLPGLSEHVTVISIVGRFLEHARIYYFHNGGADEYFIGSADMMTRNLESRVEVLAPVIPRQLQAELRKIFDTQLADPRSAWVMGPDGRYEQRKPRDDGGARSSQAAFIALADSLNKQATRLKRRRPAQLGGRRLRRIR